MVTTRPPKTIVKPTALGPVANTDTKLLIYGLFQKGRVLAQDGLRQRYAHGTRACLLEAVCSVTLDLRSEGISAISRMCTLQINGWSLARKRRCCTARSKSLTSLMPVAESPGAVRIGHPERGHLVEYLAPNSVFNSLPRQRSCSHLRPDDRFVTIDRVLHHASLGEA